jgi:hypothetical protein
VPCHKSKRLLLVAGVLALAFMCMGCGANAFDTASPAWIQVPIDSVETSALQTEADGGHRVGLLDPTQVAFDFLDQKLAIPGSTVSNVEDKKQRNGQCNVTLGLQDGRTIQLVLQQPVHKDATGIWCVHKYRFLTKE